MSLRIFSVLATFDQLRERVGDAIRTDSELTIKGVEIGDDSSDPEPATFSGPVGALSNYQEDWWVEIVTEGARVIAKRVSDASGSKIFLEVTE